MKCILSVHALLNMIFRGKYYTLQHSLNLEFFITNQQIKAYTSLFVSIRQYCNSFGSASLLTSARSFRLVG